MVAAWVIPNHYQPWASFYNDAAMIVALFLLALAVPHRERQGVPIVGLAVAAVSVVPWVQWAGGLVMFSGDAWVSSLYLFALGLALAVGHSTARREPRDFAALLAVALLTGGLASSVMALVQSLGTLGPGLWLFEVKAGGRAVANLAQPNNLASLIALAVIGVWLLFEQRRIGAVAAWSLLLLLLIGLTTAASRTSLLFVPAAAVVYGLARRQGLRWRAPAGALVAVLALQLLLAWAWPVLSEGLLLAVPDGVAAHGLQTTRTAVWWSLIDALRLAPWQGYGWLQTGTAQLAVAEHHPPVGELWLHGHNVLLELLVWCGWPLGLALGLGLLGWFASRLRRMPSPEAALGMVLVAVFGVHTMLELPHHYAFFLIPVGLWVGLVEQQRGSRPLGGPAAAWALGGATAALALAIAWDYRRVEADFWLMRFESRGIGTVRAAEPAPHAPFLSGLTAFLASTRAPVAAGMTPLQMQTLQTIVSRYPYSSGLYSLASALALNQRLPEALQVMDKLRHIHGERRYQQLRRSLEQQVADGQTGLSALAAALPR